MGHLGDFGSDPGEVDTTFGWCGETLRVHPLLGDFAIVEHFDGETAEQGSVDVLRGRADLLLHPDDVERFWELAREKRQKLSDIDETFTRIIESVSGRPTKLPSDSSGGQQSTATSSEVDDYSRAMSAYEGRPDLQAAIVQAHRERQPALN